jgi:hypothetical protein
MQTVRIVQAVVLMLIVAMAASCAASKEYSSKLFAPRTQSEKDSVAVALKFLDLDESETDPGNWVSTDIITGRDTTNASLALDNFSKIYPAVPVVSAKPDSAQLKKEKESKPFYADAKTGPVVNEPVAKATGDGTLRVKKSREE